MSRESSSLSEGINAVDAKQVRLYNKSHTTRSKRKRGGPVAHVVRETEVKTIREDAYCECGGVLALTGRTKLSSPPQYVYGCTVCEAEHVLKKFYPDIVYVNVPHS